MDAGADLILGHHPHVIQGLEVYKDRLIVYSMGDFVWDWHSAYTGESFVLQVTCPRMEPLGAPSVPVFLTDRTASPPSPRQDRGQDPLAPDQAERSSADSS